MSDDWTVRVDGVWRKFGISAKGALKYGVIDTARRLLGGTKDSEHLRQGEFWALKDVSFELKRGEALGIMGVNGSGKTTLLRILNGTYSPDKGSVTLKGRVGSLIAAGAGFSPLLSGRENIHINGLLLGLTSEEIHRRFDEIVSFAGLEEFIDMPVRNYSSGMTVRLGFSIAVISVPDILLVDEVLAVGDIAFQKRCYDRIFRMRQNGTSVILVSHSLGAIWSVCDSGLFLDRGVSSGKISVEEMGRAYDVQNARNLAKSIETSAAQAGERDALVGLAKDSGAAEGGSGDAYVDWFKTCDASSWAEKREFDFAESVGIEMCVRFINPVPQVLFRFSIDAVHYKHISDADSSYADGMGLVDLDAGRYIVRAVIKKPCFKPGAYSIGIGIQQRHVATHIFYRAFAGPLIFKPRTDRFDYDAGSSIVVQFDAEFGISEVSDGARKSDSAPTAPLAAL